MEFGRDLDLNVSYLVMSLLGENLLRWPLVFCFSLRSRSFGAGCASVVATASSRCRLYCGLGGRPSGRCKACTRLVHPSADCSASLARWLTGSSRALAEAVLLCCCVVACLAQAGYVHRDVKPSNFVVGGSTQKRGLIYLIDFGLARYYRSKEDGKVSGGAFAVHGTAVALTHHALSVLSDPSAARSDQRVSRDAALRLCERAPRARSGLPRRSLVPALHLGGAWKHCIIRRAVLTVCCLRVQEFCTGELPWTLKREKEDIGTIKEQFLTPQTLLKGARSAPV